jgi:hypothetical protein
MRIHILGQNGKWHKVMPNIYFGDKKKCFMISYVRKAYIKPATKSTKVTTLWRFIILALPTVGRPYVEKKQKLKFK